MRRWACICRFGGIGDNLVVASALRPLKRLGYMVEVITSPGAACVFLNNPFIDKLSVKKDGEIPSGDDWQKWFASRAGEYDLLVNLSHSMEGRHALHKGASAFWWPEEYRRKMCAGSYLETAHDIVGVAHEFGPLFFPTQDEKDHAARTREKIGGRYLAWALSGSRIDKAWPFTAHAVCRIIKELGIPVVLIGSSGKQFEMAKIVLEEVQRTNSSHKDLHVAISPENSDPGGHQHWSIRRSLTQATMADLVVTPDTGIAWAVAMEAMPKISLLSHASAENITKHWVNTVTLHANQNDVPCWPCHRLHDDISTCTPNKEGNAAACMSNISVETLMQAVEKLWRKPDNVRTLREVAA